MRYIADSNGYLKEVSFGADVSCGGVDCVEYVGAIPSGYSSLSAWFDREHERLYQWKIVEQDLVRDKDVEEPTGGAEYVKTVNGVTPDENGNVDLGELPKIVSVTQEEYNELKDAGEVDPTAMYLIARDDS